MKNLSLGRRQIGLLAMAGGLAGILLLTACQAGTSGPLQGSGALEGRQVAVSSELGGRIVTQTVDEGSVVTAGQLLLQLDDVQARAQLAQVQAALSAAKANLARIEAGARDEEIAAAEAQLQEAQARRTGAEQSLLHAREAVTRPVELDLQIAQAKSQVRLAEEAAQKALADFDAEKTLYHIYIELKSDVDDDTKRSWDMRMAAAQNVVTQANASRDAAKADLQGLQAQRANPIQARAAVHAAEATYSATLAAVQAVEANLADLKAGARPQEVAIAEAQVAQAQATLSMTLVSQELLTLTAPISGMVTSRSYYVGETAPAGIPLLILSDMDVLYLTVYIPEARLNEVRIGQPAEVKTDTYGDERFTGTVDRIGKEAEFTPRSIQTADDRARLVFAVRIRIDNAGGRLRPGMPAEATFLP